MRILLVIPSITNYFTFLDELTEECINQGHEVALISSPIHFRNVNCYNDVPCCRYFPVELPQGLNIMKHIQAAGKIRKIVDDFQPDIIHAHIGAAIFAVCLATGRKWSKVKVVATHHGLLGPSMAGLKGRIASVAERFTFSKVDRIFLLNQSDADWLQKRGINKKIHVYKSLGIGCRTDVFDPNLVPLDRSGKLRFDLGISDSDFVFIFIGRHVWFKGFDLVVRAFMELYVKNPRARLLLLGEPYSVHPSGLSDEEHQQMVNHSAIKRVGWVNNVQDYLFISDLNLFPSEREGMPVNIMESLSMGVPVITRDTRGCHDIIEDGVNGMILKERSERELLSFMVELLNDKSKLEVLSQNALRCRNKLDRSCWIREQIREYDHLLETAD